MPSQGCKVTRKLAIMTIVAGVLVCAAICYGAGEKCSPERVQMLKQNCLRIATDVDGTLRTAESIERAAFDLAVIATKDVVVCIAGAANTISGIAMNCNPESPTMNP